MNPKKECEHNFVERFQEIGCPRDPARCTKCGAFEPWFTEEVKRMIKK